MIMVPTKWILFLALLCYQDGTNGFFMNLKSISMRNARWLNDNHLAWYHSYVPDVMKLLTSGAGEDDDQKPGFDPGDIPSVQQINHRLGALCAKANFTFASMNMSQSCASDLGFLVCKSTDLTNSLIEMASKYCQTRGNIANVQACQEHVKKQREANMWTAQFVDSFGKVSGGWLSGSYMHLGSYQQCTQLQVKKTKSANQQPDFAGKYCHATFSAPLSHTRSNLATACHNRNFTQACAPRSNSYTVKWGFCLPKSCTIREANILVHAIFHVAKLPLCPEKPLVLCVEKPSLATDAPAIAMTVICAIFGLLIIAATTYDLIERKVLTKEWLGCFGEQKHSNEYAQTSTREDTVEVEQESDQGLGHGHDQYKWYTKLFLAFSIYTNLKMFLRTKAVGRLRCLDGIRVLTMAWVVLANSHLLLIDFIGNATSLLKMPGVLAFQFINNGSFSTDTFLLLSGLLHAYVWFRKSGSADSKRRKTSFLKKSGFTILKRLLRILPVYAFILGLVTAFWAHVGEGPMWMTARYHHGGPFFCQYTWWINLLFLNNFLGLDYPCMAWTWHVAVDMQLFLLAIPILILYRKRALAGLLVSAVLIVLSIIVNGIIAASYSLPPSLLSSTDLNKYESVNEYYSKIYVKPYMRWNSYLIGIFVGFALRQTQPINNCRYMKLLTISPINTAAWAAVVAICSSVVYGLHNFANGSETNPAANIVYAALSRTVWALAIGLLILLCLRAKRGLVAWFLSWSLWTPLSRLTYCAFLLHSFAIVFFYGTTKEWLQYSFGNAVYFWLSTLIMSYAFGLIAHLCIEAPAVRIGRIFFGSSAASTAEASAQTLKLLERDTNADTSIEPR